MKKEETKSNKQLLLICQLFYPEMISTGQILTELCERLVKHGCLIQVLAGPPTIVDNQKKIDKIIEYKGIYIYRVWGTRFPKLSLSGRIINQITFAVSIFFKLLLDNSKDTILVTTNPPFLGTLCAIISVLKNRKFIYLLHDLYPETLINLGVIKKNGIIAILWRRFNLFTYKNAVTIIPIGRCMYDKLIQSIGEQIVPKTKTIYLWSNINPNLNYGRDDNPFIKKWNLENKFVLIYSGNMGRFHDLETIMESARYFSKNNPEIHFLFVGEGHKKNYCQEFSKKLEINNCQFFSYVEQKDLPFSLSSGHIGLVSLLPKQAGLSVPSKTYGFLAVGLPVIGILPVGSEISKLITEENCGIVVEPGNSNSLIRAILKFYNNRLLLGEMGERSKKAIINKYNLETAALSFLREI